MTKTFKLFTFFLLGTFFLSSCSDDDKNDNYSYDYNTSGATTLSSQNWETSEVLDEQGLSLNLTDSIVQKYVGYSFYKKDGDFRTVNLDNTNKMYGKWALLDEHKILHLDVYNSFNEVTEKINVQVLSLTDSLFSYRVNYDSSDNSKYLDIRNISTTHAEPKTPAQILAGTSWKTTKIYNIVSFYIDDKKDNPIDPTKLSAEGLRKALDADMLPALNNDSLPQSKYVGDIYYGSVNASNYFETTTIDNVEYYTNGKYSMSEYNDPTVVISQGNWYLSLDGKYRTHNALDSNNTNILSTNVVYVFELTDKKFSYIIADGTDILLVEHDAK